jgi:translation initiation factor 6 (eIF-6)
MTANETIKDLFLRWTLIRTQKQQEAWEKKVVDTKFGTYGTIGILEIISNNGLVLSNEVAQKDFINEIKLVLNRNRPYKPFGEI